ncbi:MAG TPA: low molecular weight protein-tyrosine-phosphatase [Jatrophihabitans sp.]
MRVCFVCSGNICRSPTAEVVFRAQAEDAGYAVIVDSAGTGDWLPRGGEVSPREVPPSGDEMDRRSRATLLAAGYSPAHHAAKQFRADYFAERDVVVALDSGHLAELRRLAAYADDPEAARASIVLLRDFDSAADVDDRDVADPYYGGTRGFEDVLAQIQRASAGLLAHVQTG